MLTFKLTTAGKEYYFRAKSEAEAIKVAEQDHKYFKLYLRLITGDKTDATRNILIKEKNKSWWKWW